MRRWLNLAVAFSIFGAIAAVIASWIMALIASPMTIDPLWIAALRREAWERAERRGENTESAPWISQAFASRVGEVVYVVDGNRTIERHAYGWPWRSLDGQRVIEGPRRSPARVSVEGALRLERELALVYAQPGSVSSMVGQKVAVLLPLTPRWPGFAIATAAHAIVLFLGWAAFLVLRGRLRRWRGRCQHCAYPVGASPKCSECGTAVRNATLSA